MGVLDDAIREHLELKRRRGADPGSLKREEDEALGEVVRSEPPSGEPEAQQPGHELESQDTDPGELAADEPSPSAEEVGQQPTAAFAPGEVAEALGNGEAEPQTDDPRSQGDPAEAAPEQIEGADPAPYDAEDADDPEDVLQETPDFLEDAPEHDKLWFEQKPPKDFDF